MANEDQLSILKQGIDVWLLWRVDHSNQSIDLSRADLSGENLQGVNFATANLYKANLCKTNLHRANLYSTELLEANLNKANLSKANLQKANLRKANLGEANLSEADLSQADFSGTNLHRANFNKILNLEGAIFRDIEEIPEGITQGLNDEGVYSKKRLIVSIRNGFKKLNGVDLRYTDLSKANLNKADLSGANLSGANLSGANLRGANLRGASLRGTNLRGTNFFGVDLSGVDLSKTDLSGKDFRQATLCYATFTGTSLYKANLTDANITGAFLYGTARDDWVIDNVQCDYVYWDDKPSFSGEEEEEKQWEVEHRTPKDRDFRPGEFEELYKQLPTFDYYFKHGFTPLDPLIMDQVVQAINERNPNIELKLDSFHSRGQPHAVFTVLHKEAIEDALKQITTDYEMKLKVLEGQRDVLMELISTAVSRGFHIERVEGNLTIKARRDIIAGNKGQRSISPGRDYVEHVEGDVTTGVSTQGIEAKDMSQLNTKEECMAHYKLLSEKLFELRQAYILETDTEVKFKLKKNIEKYEADLTEIERRLEKLENKEDSTQKE